MCFNPLKSPLTGIGLASKAIKKGGVMGAISPGLALAGAFKKKKPTTTISNAGMAASGIGG